MDPRQNTENFEATSAEDDDHLALEDGDEVEEFDDDEADDAEVSEAKPSRDTERELDHGLKETFPASDPVSINPGAD